MLIVAATGAMVRRVSGVWAAGDVRLVVALKITASAAGQFLGLFALTLVLRGRGMSLSDLGLWRVPRPAGWIAAVFLAGASVLLLSAGPVRSRIVWTDMSAFRLYTAILAGVAAGCCEEIVFRGYIMTALGRSGVGLVGQLVGAAALFGLAHVGWSSGGSAREMLAPIINTGIAGLLYGCVYVIGGRTLMPVIMAHAVTDMLIEPWLLLASLSR